MTSKADPYRAYFEDPFPEEETYPRYGRDMADRGHAVFMIVGYLDGLRLSNWTHTLLTWLRHYDGLQYHLHEHDDPMVSVRQLLARYTMGGRPVTANRFAEDLCGLNFLKYRAAWERAGARRCWMPLEQPWLEFVDQGEDGEELLGWYSPEAWPPSDQVRLHLLGRFVRRNGVGS